jgi:uncharacterized membrane protein
MERFKKIREFFCKSGTILLLILILGFALRLVNLGTEPYWGDETYDLGVIQQYQHSASGIIEYFRSADISPPLYGLILNYWTGWFGFGEFIVRLLSVLFGLAVIFLAYLAGKIIFKNKNAGLFAALITAVLPMQIEFSQEARPYIFFCFFGLLAIIALWQYFEKKKLKYLAVYAAAILAGLYLHYSFGFVLLSTAAFWLFKIIFEPQERGRELAKLSFVYGVIFIGFFWWLDVFLMRICLGKILLFGAPRDYVAVRNLDFFDSLFNQLIWLTKEKILSRPEIISILLFKIAFLSAVVCLAGKFHYSFKKIWSDGKFYLIWIFLLSSIIFLFSPQSFQYVTIFEKHIIVGSVIFALLFAFLLAKINSRKIKVLILVIFLASLLGCDIQILADDSTSDPYFNLKNVAQHINQYYQPGDIVLINFSSGRTDFNFYLDKKISAIGVYPARLLNDDIYYSRGTLGFLENEFQFRSDSLTEKGVAEKLNIIVKSNNPRRVWIYGRDNLILRYFNNNGWRLAFAPIGDIFPVSLYVKN